MILKRSSEYDGDTKDFDNIIEAMEECRIFKIEKESDGLFGLTECCDNFYGVSLSKEQLIDLGYALIYTAERGFVSGSKCQWKRSHPTFNIGIVNPHDNVIFSDTLRMCNTCGKRIEVID